MKFSCRIYPATSRKDKFANALINIPKIAKWEVIVICNRSAPLMGLKQVDEVLTMLKPLAELVQLRWGISDFTRA